MMHRQRKSLVLEQKTGMTPDKLRQQGTGTLKSGSIGKGKP